MMVAKKGCSAPVRMAITKRTVGSPACRPTLDARHSRVLAIQAFARRHHVRRPQAFHARFICIGVTVSDPWMRSTAAGKSGDEAGRRLSRVGFNAVPA